MKLKKGAESFPMGEFFIANWSTITLSLITAGLLAFCRWLWKQLKDYKDMLVEKEDEILNQTIEHKLEPIVQELENLREYARDNDMENQRKWNLVIASYKFRLVQLCSIYLNKGSMTQDQFDQLTEFYKMYSDLGGNGQAKEYYDKTLVLPIINE